MKQIFSILVAISIFSFHAQAQAIPRNPVQKEFASVTSVFVPGGFGTESDIYVIARGVFPNGCYSWSHGELEHLNEFSHVVKPIANVIVGSYCTMALVPFEVEISLGRFAAGRHDVQFKNADGSVIQSVVDVEP